MRSAREEHGFTLIELLVTMAVAMVVFGATIDALDAFQSNDRFDILRNEAQDNARNALDLLAREFRNVAAPKIVPEVPGALEQAGPYSLMFQTINPSSQVAKGKNATGAMRVRYCLNDSTPSDEILWRQTQTWETEGAPKLPSATACPDLNAGDWASSAQLVQHITNDDGGQERPLFVYGPKGASEVSQIISVEPTLYINVNPSQPSHPGETQLTSSISLRNANRQPIAAFTAKEVNGHVQLNASESTDPNGLALTYRWTEGKEVAGKEEGETVISSTAQQYETPEVLASKSVHKYWLRVTDPGGLTASTKQEVTIK